MKLTAACFVLNCCRLLNVLSEFGVKGSRLNSALTTAMKTLPQHFVRSLFYSLVWLYQGRLKLSISDLNGEFVSLFCL